MAKKIVVTEYISLDGVIEAMTARMEAIAAMAIRRETAEHPFSTIKAREWAQPISYARD
jgi:hypothetical protein